MSKKPRATKPADLRPLRDMSEADLARVLQAGYLQLARFCRTIADEHDLAGMRSSSDWLADVAKEVGERGLDVFAGDHGQAHFRMLTDFEARFVNGTEEPVRSILLAWKTLILEAHGKAIRERREFSVKGAIAEGKAALERGRRAMESFTDAASRQREAVTSAAALMLVAITRAETVEYPLRMQARDLLRFCGRDKAGLDRESWAMVGLEVLQTPDGPKSDLRCVRNAASHAHYEVLDETGDWSLQFENAEDEFRRRYSRKEFERFTDTYYLLYQMILAMLDVHELRVVVAAAATGAARRGGGEEPAPSA